MPPTLSIVVPVYNSEQTLGVLADRVAAAMDTSGYTWELLLVNDGSEDQSWVKIVALAERDPHVRGLDFARNYGENNALLAGIRAARGEIIVTIDDDLQHPPEEIPKLVERIEEGYDVVYGASRRMAHGAVRNFLSRAIKLTLRYAMGAETAEKVTSFRAIRASIRSAFAHFQGSLVSVDVLFTWGASRFSSVEVQHQPRLAGRSNYDLARLVRHGLTLITGFSTVPLRVASILGLVFTSFGFLVLADVLIYYWIEGRVVPGFTFLASIIAIFSGAQLFALGVMGEYIARIHMRLLDRPTYSIRQTIGDSAPPD